MKIKCLDVVHDVGKSGNSYTSGAFRAVGKSGNPFLFIASCPGDYKPSAEYDVRVTFGQKGNFILPY